MTDTAEQSGAPPAVGAPPGTIFLIAAWFAWLTALGEIAIMVAKEIAPNTVLINSQFIYWMTPLADLGLFMGLALVAGAVCRHWPALNSLKLIIFVFAFPGFFSWTLMFTGLHPIARFILSVGLAVQVARLAGAHPSRVFSVLRDTLGWSEFFTTRAKATAPGEATPSRQVLSRRQFLISTSAVLAGAAAGVHGWHWTAEEYALSKLPRAPVGGPNLLLIVLDTVRAKSLSLYGNSRLTTPNLERFAKQGVTFQRAISTAPWTLPAHGSLFTGHYPHALSAGRLTALDAAYPTLAEILSGQSYFTAGFAANLTYCSYEFGLNRGFAHYEDYPVSLGQIALSSTLSEALVDNDLIRNQLGYHQSLNRISAAAINQSFLSWLSNHDRGPFFGFLNYFDAHEAYLPPPPFDTLFGPRRPRGPFQHYANDSDLANKASISPTGIQVELDAYEGAIAYLDAQVGLLLEELEKRGALKNTVVIITADHGEQFGEHGLLDHGNSLYLPLLHVPLLMWQPARLPAGIVVPEPVSLRDVPATILDLLGIAGGPKIPGNSLALVARGSGAVASPLLSEVERLDGRPGWHPPATRGAMQSLVAGGYHYIVNGDGQEELYDWLRDPDEAQDLAGWADSRPVLAELREKLSAAGSL